jgi:hypothetical protein
MNMRNFLVLTLLILGIVVRFYRFDAPVADWHSWRQADTVSVLKRFIGEGFDPLRPKYHDLSNIPSGKDNPEGYRMVEFPLYQTLGYFLVKIIPGLTSEMALRLLTIAASVGTGFLLYLLFCWTISKSAAVIVLAVQLFLPFSIYYGRTILPDPLAVFLALSSVAAYTNFQKNHGHLRMIIGALSIMTGALAILTKPVAVFLLVPVGLLFLAKTNKNRRDYGYFMLYVVSVLFPFVWWRTWISQYPEGIASYGWLFNQSGIRFKGAWFYWLFAERLGKLILGYFGLVPFLIGVMMPSVKKERRLFEGLIIGTLSYLVVIAQGNVQHDYYQIIVLPSVSLLIARGIMGFVRITGGKLAANIYGVLVMMASFAFSWYTIRTYYWINRPEIVEAGKIADRILPADAKIIAPYNGDTTFLYQTGRVGWPLGFDIDKKISQGATHYVTISPSDNDLETRDLAAKYKVIVRNDKYAIIDLTQRK